MLQRAAAVVVALVLAVTSGSFGGVAYLCLMDGKVRASCCCAKASTERDQAPEACSQIQRSRDCGEVQVSEHKQAPARFEIGERPIHLVSFVVALPPPAAMAPPPQEAASLPPGARGPPPPTGPPLFVWNCSYLI